MDILKPEIIRIDGRCYRRNPLQHKTVEEYEAEELNSSNVAADEAYLDEVCDAFVNNIEETSNGFRVSLDVPSAFFKYIIGRKGETKKRIENETRTQIWLPARGKEGPITINGKERKGVVSAKTRIDLMVTSAREREPFTHFLSIPIQSDTIKDNFAAFKEDILNTCGDDRGIDGTIFQNPSKLHLTIGTMPLLNDAEISQAKTILEQCKEEIIGPILGDTALECLVQGLEYMNDDPGEVDVLYVQVNPRDGSDRLQLVADRLVDKFSSAGLMSQQYERVKLHITVMNTLFRKDPAAAGVATSGGRREPMRGRESFDATNVLQIHRAYDLGIYTIPEIHLSQRYSTGNDGYYGCEEKLIL